MTRIFISHSHSDEAIAYKLFDFLVCVFPELGEDNILCTSDPNSGLSYDSNPISDQLKQNLKGAEALVALITIDSLRSLWIPFEIGSFWTTEKPIVLILGPDLTPDNLPGPLKGWLSINVEDDQAFTQLNAMVNQLEKKLNSRQNVKRHRRDRHLREFISRFKAWTPRLNASDLSQQAKIDELTQKLESQKRSQKQKIAEIEQTTQFQKQELERVHQSQIDTKELEITRLLEQERSQQQQQQLTAIETASKQEKADLERNYQNQINQLKQQLAEERSQFTIQLAESEQAYQQKLEVLKELKRERDATQSFTENLGNGIKLEMITIPGGKFLMGSPEGEGSDDEKPQHEVTTSPFFLGKYPITQAQYQQIMGHNPSCFKGDDLPVEQVSWDDAVQFCQLLSHLTGKEYRLPSEAEWEYACRAGTTTLYNFGDRITNKLANYNRNVGQTSAIGKFSPNTFGLYDMHGNVWEWCQDNWYSYYTNAPSDGSARILLNNLSVVRGGSWGNSSNYCRSAIRNNYARYDRDDDIGFRVACVAPRTK